MSQTKKIISSDWKQDIIQRKREIDYTYKDKKKKSYLAKLYTKEDNTAEA